MSAVVQQYEREQRGRAGSVRIVPQARARFNPTRESVNLFVPGSTAGLTTIEFEPGCVADLKAAFERVAPRGAEYDHNARWGDGNGFAHVRAALLGPSLTVPVGNGAPLLGTWQQVVLVDFDNRGRDRKVVVTVTGER